MKGQYKQTFASYDFGIKTGLHSMYREWILPRGMDADQCFQYIIIGKPSSRWKRNEEAIVELYNEIIELNPELASIPTDDVQQKFDVFMGAISKFNYKDIEFFTGQREAIMDYNLQNRNNVAKIQQKAGEMVYWVICPENIEFLNKSLGITH